MHLLLTGAAGYIGSAVTSRLLAEGWSVTGFDRLLFGGDSLLPFIDHPRFRLVVGDVRDTDVLASAAAGTAAMVHLAAIVGEAACSVDDEAAWSINVDGTASALEAAQRAGVGRFVLISTCSNYGVAGPDVIADEDSPLNPLSRYAEAKVRAERIALAPGRIPATVLRFGTICGLSARMRFDLLVSELARAAARREPVSLYTPDAWRPFLHVHDAARALEAWAIAPIAHVNGRIFNVVGENHQKRTLAGLVQRHYPDTEITVTDRATDARDYRVSGARIDRELGFRPARTVEQAFVETAEAVERGLFRDPTWPGHSAIPPDPGMLRFRLAAATAG